MFQCEDAMIDAGMCTADQYTEADVVTLVTAYRARRRSARNESYIRRYVGKVHNFTYHATTSDGHGRYRTVPSRAVHTAAHSHRFSRSGLGAIALE